MGRARIIMYGGGGQPYGGGGGGGGTHGGYQPPQQQHSFAVSHPTMLHRRPNGGGAGGTGSIGAIGDYTVPMRPIRGRKTHDDQNRPIVYLDPGQPNVIHCPGLSHDTISQIEAQLEVPGVRVEDAEERGEDACGGAEGLDSAKWVLTAESQSGADAETIRQCSPDGERCFFNPGRFCYRNPDPLNRDEGFLYPYRRYRKDKTKTWFQLNIRGSALFAGWKQIMMLFTINVLLSLLIIFEIIPESIFPIDSAAINTIFTVFTFIL